LTADENLVARWNQRLGKASALRVGIAWRGSPRNVWDHERSIPLAQFSTLAGSPKVRLYSLQVVAGRGELQASPLRDAITDLAGDLHDFADTAALVRNLDLVVTCDSAPAHLAGALGVPVWVALPFAPDWRWMLDREDSPWYPTMRLFRQRRPGDWADVFSRIETAMAQRMAGGPLNR
jgi:ADP-heptose:LPS heptosyltransferase